MSVNWCDISRALTAQVTSMSALKICLATLSETNCGEKEVRLTTHNFMELTGLSKQSVLNGLDTALEQDWIIRTPAGNSFWYKFETKNLDQNGTRIRPKRSTIQTKTVQELDQEGSKSLTVPSQELDQTQKPSLYTKSSKLASKPDKAENQNQEAFQAIAHIVKSNGIRLLVSQGFDFELAVDVWGDLLPKLWQNALRFSDRKHGDQPIYRFKAACERTLDLGLEPPVKAPPPTPPAEPDENGIIIGQRYWNTRLNQPVLVEKHLGSGDYGADIGTNGVIGRRDIVRLEVLEPLRAAHAA